MVILSNPTKEKCRWHLGYNQTAVAPGDSSLLEYRMDNVQDASFATRIDTLVGICDNLETDWLTASDTTVDLIDTTAGDINRATTRESAYYNSNRKRKQAYLQATDRLSLALAVPNYQHPETWERSFIFPGGAITGGSSSGGGGTGAVSSVFGRTGAVVAASGDYAIGQISGAGSMASQNNGSVDIQGGYIDGLPLGSRTTIPLIYAQEMQLTGSNPKLIWTPPSSPQVLSSGTQSIDYNLFQRVQASVPLTLTSVNNIASYATDGAWMLLQNTGSNNITFTNNNGVNLRGTFILKPNNWALWLRQFGTWVLMQCSGTVESAAVWTNLTIASPWAATGSPAPSYTKFMGRVYLRGVVQATYSSLSPGSIITTLPAGFRPINNTIIFPNDQSGALGSRLDLSTSGQLTFLYSTVRPSSPTATYDGINTFSSLYSIQFDVD